MVVWMALPENTDDQLPNNYQLGGGGELHEGMIPGSVWS